MTFHAWLRREMEHRKLSIAAFAATLGYSTETVSRWRIDRMPNEFQMADIATAFGMRRQEIQYAGARKSSEWCDLHTQQLIDHRAFGRTSAAFAKLTGFHEALVCRKWNAIQADRLANGLPCLRPWTKANDRALKHMVELGKDWGQIGQCLSRTAKACKARMQRLNAGAVDSVKEKA